jgi:hypothetical protein
VTGLEALTIICTMPIAGAVSIPLVAMYQHHKRKMAEFRIQEKRMIADDIRGEFEKLRTEIRELRDVSTQYDISFDSALQQVERRLAHLERPQYGATAETDQQNILRGGRA